MTLSEAIRLGAMLRPTQAFYQLYDPATGGTCALGAAAEAIGIMDTTTRTHYVANARAKVPHSWRWVLMTVQCPVCRFTTDVQSQIRHLNNEHRWTREAIADWVEIFEPSEPSEISVSPVTEDAVSQSGEQVLP